MNNKDYINKMAERLQMSPKEVQQLTTSFVNELAERMEDGSILSVQGFGNFEVKKKMERILINPTTKQRMLIPPKLALTFKPGTTVKEILK